MKPHVGVQYPASLMGVSYNSGQNLFPIKVRDEQDVAVVRILPGDLVEVTAFPGFVHY